MTTANTDMFTMDVAELHPSLAAPGISAIEFLNEVMSRFPNAISFAPGAPHTMFIDEVHIDRYVTSFLTYLKHDKGLDPVRAGRLLREYGPARGIINDLVARALTKDYGIPVDESSVVITVGCQEAMLLSLRALCARGSDVLAVVTPAFAGILGAASVLDIEVAPVDGSGSGVDLAQLAQLCYRVRTCGRRVRALYVAPDYANPSGILMDLGTRRALLDLAEREDLVLLEDIAYGFTATPDEALPPLKQLDTRGRVIMLGTFAKVCMPGARVGFAIADQRVRDGNGSVPLATVLTTLKSVITVNTSPISQAVVGGMLLEHNGSLADLGRAKAAVYQRNLGLLLDGLDRNVAGRAPSVSWNRPTGGFFVTLRLPTRVDTALLERSAADYGVLWTPMSNFCLDNSGDRQLRLSCSYLEPAQIEEGTRRLADLLADIT